VTGRPEDHPVNKPGGGLSVDADLIGRGRGMRVLSFVRAFTQKPRETVFVPEFPTTKSAASTQSAGDENSPNRAVSEVDWSERNDVDAMATAKRRKTDDCEDADEFRQSKYSTVRGPDTKNGKQLFTFGNYETYYGSRTQDSRWTLLEEKLTKWLRDTNVLDIGCNTGRLTSFVARSKIRPRNVLGIDVDESLIAKANEKNGCDNLHFQAENFLAKEIVDGEEYDLILCFSVTKWIHFQYGDHGIRRMFRKVQRKLKTGGAFCLEYQDLKSYKKKRHLTPAIRENVRTMEFLPDEFPAFLESLGFHKIDEIAPPTMDSGFDRPILLFEKKSNSTMHP